ncbi:MOB kinase activator-like protein 1 [Cinnamomum micranthum f. kanehirae]|uniref:MOB kinase activator-like protein 1 n=1 Tax=Cinnamomum micranthum f. kanehirae TaxID=337451 RepID=A0A443PIT6_9MAGN|nr:MOB kinase activator-like protein 1 [Cinnamomum micranthum f. kanehirae]
MCIPARRTWASRPGFSSTTCSLFGLSSGKHHPGISAGRPSHHLHLGHALQPPNMHPGCSCSPASCHSQRDLPLRGFPQPFGCELLFEKDTSDVSSNTSGVTNGMQPNHALDSTSVMGEVRRFSHTCNLSHSGASCMSNNQSFHVRAGLFQDFKATSGCPSFHFDKRNSKFLRAPFPPCFREVVKTIFKRMFRVYAHIYHSHFQKIVHLKKLISILALSILFYCHGSYIRGSLDCRSSSCWI